MSETEEKQAEEIEEGPEADYEEEHKEDPK